VQLPLVALDPRTPARPLDGLGDERRDPRLQLGRHALAHLVLDEVQDLVPQLGPP